MSVIHIGCTRYYHYYRIQSTRALPIRDLVSINPIFLGARGEDISVLGFGECAYLSELKGKMELLEIVGAEE